MLTEAKKERNRQALLARKARRLGAGLCRECEAPAEIGRYCREHKERRIRYAEKSRGTPRSRPVKYRMPVSITADQVELSYAAGVIDGEGCIYFNNGTRKANTSASLSVKVAMTNGDVVGRLHHAFGGSVTDKKGTNANHLPQKVWIISGQRAYAVLVAVLPFLTGKREQARLGVEFSERVTAAPRTGYRNTQHTPETVVYIEACMTQMRELKKNGGH